MITEPFSFLQPHTGPFIVDRHIGYEPAYVYLFYSPLVKAYKIGRTKNGKNLGDRLQERTRQCGETQVLALWRCHPTEAPQKERELLEKAKPHRTGREILSWKGDFISFYAIFMQDADWSAYSMKVVYLENGEVGMTGFREAEEGWGEFVGY